MNCMKSNPRKLPATRDSYPRPATRDPRQLVTLAFEAIFVSFSRPSSIFVFCPFPREQDWHSPVYSGRLESFAEIHSTTGNSG